MSDKMRDDFEEWFYKELSVAGGVYHLAWQAWQAAIESVVVELPEPHQDEWKDLNLSTDEVVKALDDAGVKYILPDTFVRY